MFPQVNLQKDHSRNIQSYPCEFACLHLCGDVLRAAAMQMLQGAGRACPCTCSLLLLCPVHGNLKSSFVNGNCHAQLTLFSDGCLGSIIGEGDAEVR